MTACISTLSFGDAYDLNGQPTQEIESISVEIDSNIDEAFFACCDSYVTDAETGESFVAVTVCQGDNSTESYILACTKADNIRDKLLALL